MIRRVYEQVLRVKAIGEIYVATDDQRIFDHVESFGGKAMMTSPDHQSGTDRCAEVARQLNHPADILLNVQGDEPFISGDHIEKVIHCFKKKGTLIASLVKKIDTLEDLLNKNIPKVVVDNYFQALYFSRTMIPDLRDIPQTAWFSVHTFYKHIGIYGFKPEILKKIVRLPLGKLEQAERLEQLRWLENGYRIQLAETTLENISVDTPQDLENLQKKLLENSTLNKM